MIDTDRGDAGAAKSCTGIFGSLQVLDGKEIIQLAQRHQIKKAILFGSRARGDARERSAIDLAVSGGPVQASLREAIDRGQSDIDGAI